MLDVLRPRSWAPRSAVGRSPPPGPDLQWPSPAGAGPPAYRPSRMPRSEPDSGRRPPPTCSYVHEAVNPPVARAPKLDRALQAARACGEQPLVPDRTLIPIGWPAADRPFSLGKHHCHGM